MRLPSNQYYYLTKPIPYFVGMFIMKYNYNYNMIIIN